MDIQYEKCELVRLRALGLDEKWLQDKIEEDPSLLGFGDLIVVQRERKQSSGGRIDLLLHDPEAGIMYETEIMLGRTDESHIVRSIEYWDIEKRRFPSRDHKAVIVAEEITNRFFNVISLMNKAIPIVAIQLTTAKIANTITLVFTRVLDTYESPSDEEDLGAEVVDRNYWEQKSNKESIKLADSLIEIYKGEYERARITYNRGHIAVGTQRRNNFWLHPRKRMGTCHFYIRVGDVESASAILEEAGISYERGRDDSFSISMQSRLFTEKKDSIRKLIALAVRAYSE